MATRWRRWHCLVACLLLCATACWLLLANNSWNHGNCPETASRLMLARGWRGERSSFSVDLSSRVEDGVSLADACLTPDRLAGGDQWKSRPPTTGQCFAEKLSRSDRDKAMRHLSTVVTQLELAGIQYYLDMGTALGAYRHLGMIPYDEDVDIRINGEQKEAAKALLRRLRYRWPQLLFQDTEWTNQHWKVHFMDTMDPVLERHVALDVFFYRVDSTLHRLLIREPPFSFRHEDIFPLRRRPLHDRWYPTPNSIGSMIAGYFPNTSLTDCVYYLHDLPFNQCEQPVVPCHMLHTRYPFTETLQLASGQLQLLVDKGSVTKLVFIAGADRL